MEFLFCSPPLLSHSATDKGAASLTLKLLNWKLQDPGFGKDKHQNASCISGGQRIDAYISNGTGHGKVNY